MTSLTELNDKLAELSKLLKAKTPPVIPENLLSEALNALTSLAAKLESYCPPTPNEKKAAKAHPISSQIVTFTSAKERKEVFTLDYFKKKVGALPKDREIVASSFPGTLAGLRDAVILYYFRKGKGDGFKGLKDLRDTVERDYQTRPAVKKAAEAGDLLIDLMRMSDIQRIAAILAEKFPKDAALKKFATQNDLKIPLQPRGKGAIKRTPHERLAEEIHLRGGVARL
jgi:hypothetical protein